MSDKVERRKKRRSLGNVLEKTQNVETLVASGAEELSSANADIKEGLEGLPAGARLEEAVEKSAVAEAIVKQASAELSAVNRDLEGEVRDRHLLEHQFAEVVEERDAARHSALHDTLTGLPNRALFHDRLDHSLAQAKRHGWALAVMFLDLDGFKAINDRHGHEAGDAVLRCIAQRLRNNTREVDTVGRLGGDEFLYLLADIPEEMHTIQVATKITRIIQEPCVLDARTPAVTLEVKVSIGIALYPKHGGTGEELVASADKAMYTAKRTGGGITVAT